MIASIRNISQKGDPGGPWGTLGDPGGPWGTLGDPGRPWGFLMNDFMDGMVLEETRT